MIIEIDRLLLEAQRAKYTERRTEPRHVFVRPVRIRLQDGTSLQAFAKDISKQGIGVITEFPLSEGTVATLSIHSTQGQPANLKCEVRWCDEFGKGWYLTGWKFLSAAPAGIR
ncbi:MAG: PilZ domain-containing protein [Planctomycetaceae bacterium]